MTSQNPLVLDVDGTLINNDLTHELLLLGFIEKPWKILSFIFTGLESKNRLKNILTSLFGNKINAQDLPYNQSIVDFAISEGKMGRKVILCSGSHETLIKKIVDHFDWIDDGYGTTKDINLTSTNKADFLKKRYPDGFDYIGNSIHDYEVWKTADRAYSYQAPKTASNIITATGNSVESLGERKIPIKFVFKALRLHQWAKNTLLFLVPILTFDQLHLNNALSLFLGFIAMGLLASGTYVFNDAIDIQNDRQSMSKKARPLASGTLSVPAGIVLFVSCIIIAIGICAALPAAFGFYLLTYFVITMSYSVFLKRLVIIDVITLALLFFIRVLAGAAIVSMPMSEWLASFILTFFLCLSLTKRYTELVKLDARGITSISGRGYDTHDIPLLLGFGMMATAMTILSFILYGLVAEEPVLKANTSIIIVGFILVYWLLRVWYLAHRGQLNDDPVLFAVKDKLSIFLGGLILLVVLTERVENLHLF